jgi:hypothetical protein
MNPSTKTLAMRPIGLCLAMSRSSQNLFDALVIRFSSIW